MTAANKVFHITERTTFTFRADLINLLNKPQWVGTPGQPPVDTNINSATF